METMRKGFKKLFGGKGRKESGPSEQGPEVEDDSPCTGGEPQEDEFEEDNYDVVRQRQTRSNLREIAMCFMLGLNQRQHFLTCF